MNTIVEAMVTIALAVVGLGIVSVIVSRNANTSGVIGATTGGFAKDLAAAEAPVTSSSGNVPFFGAAQDMSYGLGS